MASIKTERALHHLRAELAADAQAAAGPDRQISRADQAALDPWLGGRADALRAEKKGARIRVDALVERAAADAAATWATFNTRGPTFLSQAEVRAIGQADPALGALTARAVAAAKAEQSPPTVPAPVITTATPGVELSRAGELLTVRAGPEVAENGAIALSLDGHALELRRFPGGVRALRLDAGVPEGYGAEQVSSGVATDGRAELVLRLARDPAGSTSEAAALTAARKRLREYVQFERVNDPDWQSNLGLTWPQAVAAGVLDDLEAFGTTPDAEHVRYPDRFVFVGRGPLDLYTEVTVNKADGQVSGVLVEID